LGLAEQHHLHSIAFPAISCGIYAFPVERAADIVMKTLAEDLPKRPSIAQVLFAVREGVVETAFRRALEAARSAGLP
ncbi:MAG: macro domain-containing protein, partial [Vicinamibacteria bacterium]|nr:macro domain-containing protein [Vicinamibacteria bacterium]